MLALSVENALMNYTLTCHGPLLTCQLRITTGIFVDTILLVDSKFSMSQVINFVTWSKYFGRSLKSSHYNFVNL